MGRWLSAGRDAGEGLAARARARAAPRVSGYPTSSNRASSLHLRWELPGPVRAVSVELVVESLPVVADLYFWALQASFVDDRGRHHGAGHVGLQWYPAHPGSRAVNWGGYGPDGRVLDGSASPLPSASDNPNTRDLWWEPGQPYTLGIARAGGDDEAGGVGGVGGWAGLVDGVPVRRLYAGGDRLDGLIVWSEVFARCDAPPVAVRWANLRATTVGGEVVRPAAVHVNYQRRDAGGCDNTTALLVPDESASAVRQITNSSRATPQGTRLPLAGA